LRPFGRPDPDEYKRAIGRGLTRALAGADVEVLDLQQRAVAIFSDHHKGARDGADDFQRCERAYNAALGYYLDRGHRLLVLGDAEELWECHPEEVLTAYPRTLELEAEFHKHGRYERFWGNHDDQWRHPGQVKKHLGPIFPELQVREALRLRVINDGTELGVLFLVHGHQGTLDSDRLAWLSRLVVRYAWRPLQRRLNVRSTSPAVDWVLREAHDRAMFEWARRQRSLVLVAGHTHRPVFGVSQPQPDLVSLETADPEAAAAATHSAERRAENEWNRAEERRVNAQRPEPMVPPCYFNTGCCSFGDGDVTGLEIADGQIRLVRWPNESGHPLPTILACEKLSRIFELVNAEAPQRES
jgi:hypothetical protein